MAKDSKCSKGYMPQSDNFDDNNRDAALTSSLVGNKSLFNNPFKSPKQSKDNAKTKSSPTPVASRSKSNERSSSSPSLMPKTYSKSTFYTELTPGPNTMGSRDSAATTAASSGISRELGTSQSINKTAPVPISNTNPLHYPSNSSKQASSSSYSDIVETTLVADTEKKLHTNSLPRESRQGKRLGSNLEGSRSCGASGNVGPLQQPLFSSHSLSAINMANSAYANGSSYGNIHNNDDNLDTRNRLEVGDRVGIYIDDQFRKGVVKWKGVVDSACMGKEFELGVLGVEMDESNEYCTDGTLKDKRYFECPPKKGLFISARDCHPLYQDFGDMLCPVVEQTQKAKSMKNQDVEGLCGRNKGIQGHYNSCYLDATLFSMFTFTEVFDNLLFRPKEATDIQEYEKVQKVLSDKIVNPLRRDMYVRADRIMELRELLDELGSVSGLTCEEKDPEEFLNSLLQQILKAKPLLQLNSGQESYYYQLFVEKHEKIVLPTLQHLLEQSFHSSNVKLKEEPSCLIVLMPRFGKSFKVYPRIFPSLVLDVTEIIENVPRLCSSCGQMRATVECMACFQESTDPLNCLCAFCNTCSNKVHSHHDRKNHKLAKLILPGEYLDVQNQTTIPQLYMDLFAVVCIETSHYVSFVRCSKSPEAPWCFFDSMADRKGEQNGYNIPEISACPDLQHWLTDEGYSDLLMYYTESTQGTNPPPNYVKRLLNDVYMCMYVSPTMEMYK